MSYWAGEFVSRWRDDLPFLLVSRTDARRSESIHPPPDMLSPLVARYPDLPERIRRARLGLRNPPLRFKTTCPTCGVTVETGTTRRRFCSDRCASRGRRLA